MRRGTLCALTALALASCATVPQPASVTAFSMMQLPGWAGEDHLAALGLVRDVCAEGAAAGTSACEAARAPRAWSEASARTFLEIHFRAEPVASDGVLTAYFTPVYSARRKPDDEFSAPLRPPPDDPAPAPDRAAIDATRAPDALAWMRPEDLFFLQVQGSGVLVFADGTRSRAVFAGSNDRAFVAIAGPMVAEGLIPAAAANASGVHAWLAAHRGPEAEAVMRLDPRYVFFRLESDDGTPPRGSAGATLIAGRSLAIDPAWHRWFELIWIDAEQPALAGARPAYRRLAAAMDSGAAIKGEARADLYLGQGQAAGEEAGAVRHRLRLYRIVPVEAAQP